MSESEKMSSEKLIMRLKHQVQGIELQAARDAATIAERDATIAELRKQLDEAKAALEKIGAQDRTAMWMRCNDCETPEVCGPMLGCHTVTKNGGSTIQQLVAAALAASRQQGEATKG